MEPKAPEMHFDILTLFPEMFVGPFNHSIIKRAIDHQLVNIIIHDIRNYGIGKHKVVDDYPYGGGPGMVMMPEPLFDAVAAVKPDVNDPIILLTPQGRLFNQKMADELAKYDRLVLVCGRYEGVDERVREHAVTDEISIGDYVLSGGELAAMVIVDTVVRRLPGALGSEVVEDSHLDGLLEYPHYTRPPSYRDWVVPPVLLSGNHAQIAKWRREQSLIRTKKRRPDLLTKVQLSLQERQYLEQVKD